LVMIEQFFPGPEFTDLRSAYHHFTAFANFNLSRQSASLGMTTTVSGTDLPFFDAGAQAPSNLFPVSLSGLRSQPLSGPVTLPLLIRSELQISLTSRGSPFTVNVSSASGAVTVVPGPGWAAMSLLGTSLLMSRRRLPVH